MLSPLRCGNDGHLCCKTSLIKLCYAVADGVHKIVILFCGSKEEGTEKQSYTQTHIYTNAHTRTHTNTHTRTYIYIRTHVHTCTHTYAHTHIRTHVHTHRHTHTHTHTHPASIRSVRSERRILNETLYRFHIHTALGQVAVEARASKRGKNAWDTMRWA